MRGAFELVVRRIIEHPEAVLVEGLLIGLLHVRVGGKAEAHLVNAKRRTPLVAHAKAFGQNGKRLRFRLGRLRARVSDVSGRARVSGESRLLDIFVGFYREIFARKLKPGIRVLLIEQRR